MESPIKQMNLAQWSLLPNDLLQKIADLLLVNIVDYIRVRAVCKSWRSGITDVQQLKLPLPPQLPWLMLKYDEESEDGTFHRLSDGKEIKLTLPEARDNRIVGSTNGMFVLVDSATMVHLLNPFTRAQIHLPPLALLPQLELREHAMGEYDVVDSDDEFIIEYSFGVRESISANRAKDLLLTKVVMTTEGTVAAIVRLLDQLVFAQAGDDKWTIVGEALAWTDILHYRGQLYAVDASGCVFICGLKPECKVTQIASAPFENEAYQWYLVESLGELLLVARYLTDKPRPFPYAYETKKFEVFRIDQKKEIKLVKLQSLGDRMLFLGTAPSFSLSARDCPGFEGNRIYFTACYFEIFFDGNHGSNDFGVFNLEDGSIKPLPCFGSSSLVVWPPAIWFAPSLS